MYYRTFPPPPALEPFVDCIWVLAGAAREGGSESEIVLPDGKTELIVHFGDDFLKAEIDTATGQEAFVRQARVLMSGQLTRRILLKPVGEIGVVSARFHPAGAARFFDLPYEDIVDQVVDFAVYEKDLAATLHRDMTAAADHEHRVETMRDLLASLLIRESEEDVFVRQACRYITQSQGEYSVQDLVKLIGFSERQLERKFKKQVGITPKVLARIMRFQKFLALTQTTKELTLTDAALACGYYDQSHFIRDFTKFSGVSPLTYLTTDHALSDHFTAPT
jgi:AraC-like DNA-binding protein